jgi:hypothetical protein
VTATSAAEVGVATVVTAAAATALLGELDTTTMTNAAQSAHGTALSPPRSPPLPPQPTVLSLGLGFSPIALGPSSPTLSHTLPPSRAVELGAAYAEHLADLFAGASADTTTPACDYRDKNDELHTAEVRYVAPRTYMEP